MPANPNPALTLAIATSNVSTDLADLSGTFWSAATIQRQLDRALDRYSAVAPLFDVIQQQTTPYSRLYPYPTGAWWIERIEYPLGRWPKQYQTWFERRSPLIFDPPNASAWLTGIQPLAGTPTAGGGSLSAGTYKYAYTWVTPGGETLPSNQISVVTGAGGAVTLTNIPSGPYGVTSINLYRTTVGGSQLKLLAQLPNLSQNPQVPSGANTATWTFLDTAADASLAANAPIANTTQGDLILEIQLQQSLLPADNTGLIEITAAFKHELDASGTTVPEKHWDAIHLGAEAFCLLAQSSASADNFDYVDGQFRDRVDDTKAATAWAALAKDFMDRFEQRLATIKSQIEFTTPLYPQWGDKPVRWDRI